MSDKAPEAFRTISEVASILETPPHVLRFWETKFTQLKPVKRAGGRRYYRPSDVLLLGGIKRLLHDDGLTIRGVQKLLRTQGVRHVSGLAPARALQAVGADDEGAPMGNGADRRAPRVAAVADPAQPDLFSAIGTNTEADEPAAPAEDVLPVSDGAEADVLEDGRRLATVLRTLDRRLPPADVDALRGLAGRIAALHARMSEAAAGGAA